MIRGGLVISGCMLGIGSIYASGASSTPAGKWAIIVLIYLFIVAFAMSWAVVGRIYCSEIQPMHTRAAAASLGQCANWVSCSFFIVLTRTKLMRGWYYDGRPSTGSSRSRLLSSWPVLLLVLTSSSALARLSLPSSACASSPNPRAYLLRVWIRSSRSVRGGSSSRMAWRGCMLSIGRGIVREGKTPVRRVRRGLN